MKKGRPPLEPRIAALEARVAALEKTDLSSEASRALYAQAHTPLEMRVEAYKPLFERWPAINGSRGSK